MIPKEQDKNDELQEENNDETTKLLEYHAKNYFNSTMGVGRMFGFYLPWQYWMPYEKPYQPLKILSFSKSLSLITQRNTAQCSNIET